MAKKMMGWRTEKAQVPVTAEEEVGAMRELARDDEAVAAQVTTVFLPHRGTSFSGSGNSTSRSRR
ncbi:DUF6192 family protein [Streptomyces acidiscabies]|uniref:DUF6192 family protein n=1 Tax=Streptomyces acidiscabies TaxID=42234 RepID=UPI0038F657D8